jgi:hypothetical protein
MNRYHGCRYLVNTKPFTNQQLMAHIWMATLHFTLETRSRPRDGVGRHLGPML